MFCRLAKVAKGCPAIISSYNADFVIEPMMKVRVAYDVYSRIVIYIRLD